MSTLPPPPPLKIGHPYESFCKANVNHIRDRMAAYEQAAATSPQPLSDADRQRIQETIGPLFMASPCGTDYAGTCGTCGGECEWREVR